MIIDDENVFFSFLSYSNQAYTRTTKENRKSTKKRLYTSTKNKIKKSTLSITKQEILLV